MRYNTNQLRKEIAELIDNIKTHSDEIGNRKRIQQLELEVITAKIKKLYEKSIVFNYLHSLDEDRKEDFTEVTHNTLEHIEVPVFETFSSPREFKQETIISADNHTETAVEETVAPVAIAPEPAKPEPAAPASVSTPAPSPVTARTLRDIKEFIGLNDKIQFVSALFKSDITRYEYFIGKLNACNTAVDSKAVLNEYQHLMHWKDEDEAFQNLCSITEQRYK